MRVEAPENRSPRRQAADNRQTECHPRQPSGVRPGFGRICKRVTESDPLLGPVPFLLPDHKAVFGRRKAIDEIDAHLGHVAIFEAQLASGAIRVQLHADRPRSVRHILMRRELTADQPWRHRFTVEPQLHILDHTVHISSFFVRRDPSIGIPVDRRQHCGQHRNAGREADIQVHTFRRQPDQRRLKVLVQPVGRGSVRQAECEPQAPRQRQYLPARHQPEDNRVR